MTSRHGLITTDWADGTYDFRLGLAELEELETKHGSIFLITGRLRARTATSGEISDVVRIGLIGGGQKPAEALRMVRRYLDERPLDENRETAYLVALAALQRVHGDDLEGEIDAPEKSRSGSTSGQSGEPPQ